MFYLYVHTVPNGKIYIGMTKDLDARWNNGEGYQNNKPFYKDIDFYGWNNIKHEIIGIYETEEECHLNEIIYIIMFDTENPVFGYNKTEYKKSYLKKYENKKTAEINKKRYVPIKEENNVFEKYNKSYDVANYMIDQWIFNELHRKIVKDKCLNGLSYQALYDKYNISISQLKRIINNAQDKLAEHM